MKIEQIFKPEKEKGKKFICDSSQPFVQKFTNLYKDDGKCVFKLMQSNDIDIGSYYEFYNLDGSIQFRFTLDNNGELASFSTYLYENIGKCKKQICHLKNLKKGFEDDDVFYLDDKNKDIEPDFEVGSFFTNEEYVQAQLDIVNKINSRQD